MKPSDVLVQLGRAIAYHPKLVKPLGSVNAVIFFSQIFYWQDKADSELGVYKSADEITEETGLTYREQATARQHLIARGILIETAKRVEHRTYYKINTDELDRVWHQVFFASDDSASREMRNAHTPSDDSAIGERPFRSSASDDSAVRNKETLDYQQITSPDDSTRVRALLLSDGGNEPAPEPAKGFDDWWAVYPSKTGKKPTKAKWDRLESTWPEKKMGGTLAEVLIADTINRIEKDARWKDGFVPNPMTYLNQERWTDEVMERRAGSNAAQVTQDSNREAMQEAMRRRQARSQGVSHDRG